MVGVHNGALLEFLSAHRDNPSVRCLIREEERQTKAMNKEIGTRYQDCFHFLDTNRREESSYSVDDLVGLLLPTKTQKQA